MLGYCSEPLEKAVEGLGLSGFATEALKEYFATFAARSDSPLSAKELQDLVQRRPWYFLLRGVQNPKFILKLFLDRLVFESLSQQSQLLHRFANHHPVSEICSVWFDGSLMTASFPQLSLEICKQFSQSGFVGIVNLALRILQSIHVGFPPPSSNEVNLDEYYATIYAQAPKLLPTLDSQVLLSQGANTMRYGEKVFSLPLSRSAAELSQYCLQLNSQWIGFDLDFTLIEIKEQDRFRALIWHSVKLAILSKTWPAIAKLVFTQFYSQSPEALLASLHVSRNTVLDVGKGNLLVLDANRQVAFATHGGGGRTVTTPTYPIVWDGREPLVHVYTLFETPVAFMFLHCVDILDQMGESSSYQSVFRSLREAFRIATNSTFPHNVRNQIANTPQLVRKQPLVRAWMEQLKRQGKRLFLLTDAKESHINSMLTRAFGTNWREMFDLVVADAKKDEYFEPRHGEFVQYSSKSSRGGNIHSFRAFTEHATRVTYFGDNIKKDVCLPSLLAEWNTIYVETSQVPSSLSSSPRSLYVSFQFPVSDLVLNLGSL
ncbi:hypothetical protein BASA81_000967 [Batrachochytrium salamandrivorans]|nr:hypothetical protein BASA81_000967 [Batrachochytrium salamandrivorans]